jgi:hypothetical protein
VHKDVARLVQETIEELHACVISVESTGGQHTKYVIERCDGKHVNFYVTSGNKKLRGRQLPNMRGDLRKILR